MQKSGLVALMMVAAVVAAPWAGRPGAPQAAAPPPVAAAKLDALEQEALADVESRAQFSQQIVDQLGIKYPTVKVGSPQ